ncbi:hypothetical protein MVEN_02445100 [Mycena venus]|uniref:Uncharacterized protein n=1 Tax=Mycena venus TaxID=2733690 RepID=A0A8H7CD04_9AGAR|nr:hypothetical protein MVEN_02445100 [Mycena venus]
MATQSPSQDGLRQDLQSFPSTSDSKLTSSDKLSELPVSSGAASPNRVIRSQNARAIRRSLDSLPSFSSGDSGHSPRISQAWSTIPATKSLPRTSISENDTPRQRVSFDSDRPQVRDAAVDAASQSRSRATSPLRIFQHLSAGFHRRNENDPFVPVNPFEFLSLNSHAKTFITDTMPRQVYLYLLLRLPSMYFSRVARIFEDAEVSRPDIERMIDAGIGGDALEFYSPPNASARESVAASIRVPTPNAMHIPLPFPDEWTPAVVSPALVRFKYSWEVFITSLIKEWKTLNVVSALLLSYLRPQATPLRERRHYSLARIRADEPLLRFAEVAIRVFFPPSPLTLTAPQEARKTDTLIWWNVWTLLSMPAVFLAWSVVFFIVSIMSFVWRTGSVLDPNEPQLLGPEAILGPRIAITVVLLLGLLYFALIIATLRRYGEPPARARDSDAEAQTGPRGRTVERMSSGRKQRSRRSRIVGNRRDVDAGVEKGVDFPTVADDQPQPPNPASPSAAATWS